MNAVYFDVTENGVPEHMIRATFGFYLFVSHAAENLKGQLGVHAPTGTRSHGGEKLSQSFHTRMQSKVLYSVYSTAEHAEWVRTGTGMYGPHNSPIVPTTKKALKFHWPKANAMTVWKGDLPPEQQGNFQLWAHANGMMPFNRWPKGMRGRDYVTPSILATEVRLPSLLGRALREMRAT